MVEREELTITLPAEVVPYRDDLRRFVDAMVMKLRKNAHKGHWEGKTAEEYEKLLRDEVDELSQALLEKNCVESLLEAADVGNMAMIVSSIVVQRGS